MTANLIGTDDITGVLRQVMRRQENVSFCAAKVIEADIVLELKQHGTKLED